MNYQYIGKVNGIESFHNRKQELYYFEAGKDSEHNPILSEGYPTIEAMEQAIINWKESQLF